MSTSLEQPIVAVGRVCEGEAAVGGRVVGLPVELVVLHYVGGEEMGVEILLEPCTNYVRTIFENLCLYPLLP